MFSNGLNQGEYGGVHNYTLVLMMSAEYYGQYVELDTASYYSTSMLHEDDYTGQEIYEEQCIVDTLIDIILNLGFNNIPCFRRIRSYLVIELRRESDSTHVGIWGHCSRNQELMNMILSAYNHFRLLWVHFLDEPMSRELFQIHHQKFTESSEKFLTERMHMAMTRTSSCMDDAAAGAGSGPTPELVCLHTNNF